MGGGFLPKSEHASSSKESDSVGWVFEREEGQQVKTDMGNELTLSPTVIKSILAGQPQTGGKREGRETKAKRIVVSNK